MKLIADLHLHTVASGHAYNTVYEYAAYAKKIGLKYIGMTDHGPAMPGGPHPYHFQNLRCLPDKIHGVRIIKGIEANIMGTDGHLDVDEYTIEPLEMMIASLHMHLGFDGAGIDGNTQALINAVRHPRVTMIGHPGNPQFPIHIEAVVEECKKNRVLVEINNGSFTGVVRKGSYPVCLEIARAVKKIGWKVALSSDAHCIEKLGVVDQAMELVKEAGLTEKDIVNTSEKMVEEFVLSKSR